MADRNPYQYCIDNDQEDDQDDEYRRRKTSSSFLHDHLQEERPIRFTSVISEPLIRRIEFNLTQKKKQQKQKQNNIINHHHQQVLSQPQQPPRLKLKASNIGAEFLRIGSWKWESKNRGDLVAKFYYGKKRMVWEFLYGSMKKKMEIRWNHVSAITDYVDEDKNRILEIELGEPPEYYEERKIQRLKHTQWEKTDDFTQGQASTCRRHTVLFSQGVLDEPLKTLLQNDNRLYNLHRQPFPFHNSHFFHEPISFQNSYNISVPGVCSLVPHSNHVQNLVQPTMATSFIGHSGSNVPMPDNSYEVVSTDVSYANEITNGVLENTRINNQIQDIDPLPSSIREQDPFEGLEPLISDEQLELHHVDNRINDLAKVTTGQQNCFKVDSTFEKNHQNIFDPFVARTGGNSSCSNGGVMNDHHMAFIDEDGDDEDVCRFAELQFNDEFLIPEPCFWSFSEDSMDNSNNGGNGGSPT